MAEDMAYDFSGRRVLVTGAGKGNTDPIYMLQSTFPPFEIF